VEAARSGSARPHRKTWSGTPRESRPAPGRGLAVEVRILPPLEPRLSGHHLLPRLGEALSHRIVEVREGRTTPNHSARRLEHAQALGNDLVPMPSPVSTASSFRFSSSPPTHHCQVPGARANYAGAGPRKTVPPPWRIFDRPIPRNRPCRSASKIATRTIDFQAPCLPKAVGRRWLTNLGCAMEKPIVGSASNFECGGLRPQRAFLRESLPMARPLAGRIRTACLDDRGLASSLQGSCVLKKHSNEKPAGHGPEPLRGRGCRRAFDMGVWTRLRSRAGGAVPLCACPRPDRYVKNGDVGTLMGPWSTGRRRLITFRAKDYTQVAETRCGTTRTSRLTNLRER